MSRISKPSAARQRTAQSIAPRETFSWDRFLRSRKVQIGALWTFCIATLGMLCALHIQQDFQWTESHVITNPVISRVTFQQTDEYEHGYLREKEARQVPPYFQANISLHQVLRSNLIRLVTEFGAYENIGQLPAELKQEAAVWKLSNQELQLIRQFREPDGSASQEWVSLCEDIVNTLFMEMLLTPQDYETHILPLADNEEAHAIAIHPDPISTPAAEQTRYTSRISSINDNERLSLIISNLRGKTLQEYPYNLRTITTRVIESRLNEPTYLYDPITTAARKEFARKNLVIDEDTYHPGMNLTPNLGKIDDQTLRLLEREHNVFWRKEEARTNGARHQLSSELLASQPKPNLIATAVGVWLLCAIFNIALLSYLNNVAPRILENPWRSFAVCNTICLSLLLGTAFNSTNFKAWPTASLALPILITTLIMTVAYSRRVAITLATVLLLLFATCLRLPMGSLAALAIGIACITITLSDLRTRIQVSLAGLIAALGMGGAIVASAAARTPIAQNIPDYWKPHLYDAALTMAFAIAAGMLVQNTLQFIEKIFHITTPMSLQELNQSDHPLLKRLAEVAPGTYQHSLRIADISEAAARAIGANPLICRVGAMFHDIGKANKPEYFIENQHNGNPHDKLTPTQSSQIIHSHVKDGIAMAKEHRLPTPIQHIIASHHGTTLVSFFYHKAEQQHEDGTSTDSPEESSYRYEGPKPHTREAALLMICDALESASRTLDEYTPTKISRLVKQLINARINDGQFDECVISLKDLAKAENAISQTLLAIYHQRIKYKSMEEDEKPSSPNRMN